VIRSYRFFVDVHAIGERADNPMSPSFAWNVCQVRHKPTGDPYTKVLREGMGFSFDEAMSSAINALEYVRGAMDYSRYPLANGMPEPWDGGTGWTFKPKGVGR
jgi:hypothetical protein